MRLGHKVLVLTLGITLVLSGAIVWLVTAQVTALETRRARAAIDRSIAEYSRSLELNHARIEAAARERFEETQVRALFERVDFAESEEQRRLALGQFTGYFFTDPNEVARYNFEDFPPAFFLMINEAGEVLATVATGDSALADRLGSFASALPSVQDLSERSARLYIHDPSVAGESFGGHYLVLGVGIRSILSEPPTHGLFVGFKLTRDFAARLFGAAAARDPEREAEVSLLPIIVDGDSQYYAGAGPVDDSAFHGDEGIASAVGRLGGAADARIEFKSGTETFLGRASRIRIGNNDSAYLIVAASFDEALRPLRRLQQVILLLGAVATAIAFFACLRLSHAIARPVESLLAATERIARGEAGVKVEIARRDELGRLARGFNEMAAGLEQRDLIKNTFGKFVDPRVVEDLLSNPDLLRPGGDVRVQTILFSDIAGFTAIAERLKPDEVVSLLNEYLGGASDAVFASRGIVDKFIGDAVVAFWGPPLVDEPEHARLACFAALEFQRVALNLRPRCEGLGIPPFQIRVGIATGPVLVGNIGSPSKFNYTVMGDAANLGSRLESLNKFYRTTILIDASTARLLAAADRAGERAASPRIFTRRIDVVRVVGRDEPVTVYEIVDAAGEPNGPDESRLGFDPRDVALRCDQYESALALYESRRWTEAAQAFEAVVDESGRVDGPAAVMAARCRRFESQPPPESWDGVWIAESK